MNSAFGEFKRREKETVEEIAGKYEGKFLEIVRSRIEEKGRDGLREMYSEVYPELSNVFKNNKIEHFYYRIDSAEAADYIKRYPQEHNKLIVFLPPFETKDKFIDYFGIDIKREEENEKDFLDLVKEGFIIPMCDINPESYDNPLYREFFAEWKNRGLEDEFGYPLYANRFQEIAKLSDGERFEDYSTEIEEKIKKLGIKGEITPDPKLEKKPAYAYFSEKLAWFKLLKYDPVVETIMELLKNKEVDLAMNFAFSFHQQVPAHILYSKGGPVIFSTGDVSKASDIFKNITKRMKKRKEVRLGEVLSWISISPPFFSLRKVMKEINKRVKPLLPLAESPSDRAKDNYIILEKVDSERRDFAESFNKTSHKIENVKMDKKVEVTEIIEEVTSMEECAKNLTDGYFELFKYKPEHLKRYTPITMGVGVIGWIPLPYISTIASELLGETIERRIGGILDKEFLKYFGFGKLNIPIDVWKIEPSIGVRKYFKR